MPDGQQTVAELVLTHPGCAQVLQRHRIDYCCGGNISINAAAEAKGVEARALLEELANAIEGRDAKTTIDARELPTPQLIAHIITTHHEYLRTALPFVRALAEKVSRVHGDRNAKLTQLAVAVDDMTALMLPHLDAEEKTLFPALTTEHAHPEELWQMLVHMEGEHQEVAQVLERIHACADNFVPPAWACNSYRTLLSELAQLESDVHVHVHLENHLLKPRFAPGKDAGCLLCS